MVFNNTCLDLSLFYEENAKQILNCLNYFYFPWPLILLHCKKKSLKIHNFTTQECETFLPPFQILYLNVYTLHNLSSGKNSYPHYKYLYQWYLHLCYYFIIIQRNQGRVKLLISTAIENKSCSGGILQRVESWFHSDWKFSKGMFFHRKMLIHQNQRI